VLLLLLLLLLLPPAAACFSCCLLPVPRCTGWFVALCKRIGSCILSFVLLVTQ